MSFIKNYGMALIRDKPILRQYYKIGQVAKEARASVSQVTYLLNKEVIKHDTTTRTGRKLFLHENVQKIINVFILKRTKCFSLEGLAYYYKTGNKSFKLNE
jgi:DNA-binding transcriptional MerR regulator